MRQILLAFKVVLFSFAALLSTHLLADTRCTQEDENGNCVAYLITDTRIPGGDTSGGGWRPTGGGTGGGGNGDPNSVTQQQKEGVVAKYKLPCKKDNESAEAYSARAIAGCTKDSYDLALSEFPVLGYLPGGRVSLLGTITSLCTTHVADQIGSSKYSSC
jgi:hypothetical protein